jgi:hypothetical protein
MTLVLKMTPSCLTANGCKICFRPPQISWGSPKYTGKKWRAVSPITIPWLCKLRFRLYMMAINRFRERHHLSPRVVFAWLIHQRRALNRLDWQSNARLARQLCREQCDIEKPTIILLGKSIRLTNLMKNADFTWQKAGWNFFFVCTQQGNHVNLERMGINCCEN